MRVGRQIDKLVYDKYKRALENVYVDDLMNEIVFNRSILNWKQIKNIMKGIDKESSELEALILLRMMKREYLEKDLNENQAYYNQMMMYFKQIQKGEYYFPERVFKEEEEENDEIMDIANLLNR